MKEEGKKSAGELKVKTQPMKSEVLPTFFALAGIFLLSLN
jgi:hypothetical protein